MKEMYYQLIKNIGINDLLNYTDLSYSKKFEIIMRLHEHFTSEVINMALNEYHINYTGLNRHNNKKTTNILIGLCNKNKEKHLNGNC